MYHLYVTTDIYRICQIFVAYASESGEAWVTHWEA